MDAAPSIEVPHAEEQPAAAAREKSYLREDGTLVIDILVEPPCGASSEREIIVCASDGSEHRLNAADPPPQEEALKAEVQLGENAKVGLHAQPGRYGAVEAMVDLTIEF